MDIRQADPGGKLDGSIKHFGGWAYSSAVQCLPGKCEALSLISDNTWYKKQKTNIWMILAM